MTPASADALADVGARLDLAARGELDVGLAQQRLLAQDRLRVRGDRRVLGIDLHHRAGRVAELGLVLALVLRDQLELVDLADGDAADPDLGLLRERDRLGEVGRDLVARGLERDRPAEGDPEEEQQREAGQREADGHHDPAYRWC